MKLAVSVVTPEVKCEAKLALLSGTFEERLVKAKQYGYDGIELVMSNPASLNLKAIGELLNKNGLKPAAISTGCIASTQEITLISADANKRADAIKLLKELIYAATYLKAGIVTIGSFKGKADAVGNTQLAEEMLAEALQQIDSVALDNDISIVLEPMNRRESDILRTSEDVARYIESLGIRSVKMLLDTYHVYMNGEDISQIAQLFNNIIAHVHLADSERLPVGMGKVDFGSIECELSKINYCGWQSAELSREGTPDQNAKITLDNIKKIINSIGC